MLSLYILDLHNLKKFLFSGYTGSLFLLCLVAQPIQALALTSPVISVTGDHWQFSVPDAHPFTNDNQAWSTYVHYVAISSTGTSVSSATDQNVVDFTSAPTTSGIEVIESEGQVDGICNPHYTGDPVVDFACITSAIGETSYVTASALRASQPTGPTLSVSRNGSILSVIATFSEAVDSTSQPLVTFSPDISTISSFNSGAWSSNSKTYTASTTVQAEQYNSSITVTVSGTQTQSDALQIPTTSSEVFYIDTRSPTITLAGSASMTINNGSVFVDPSATSTDATGGQISVVTTGNVDTATNGTYTLTYTATDTNGNIASTTRTILVQSLPSPPGTTDLQADTQLTSDTYRANVTTNNFSTSTISFSSDTTTASLDLSSVMSGTQATLLGDIVVLDSASAGNIYALLPSGTIITTKEALTPWNGIFNLFNIANTYTSPTVSAGNTASVVSAVEIGSNNTALSANTPVLIKFTGQTGKKVGWSNGVVFNIINTVCNDASNPTVFSDNNDCAINSGNDLLVWTKHFTVFITYIEAPPPPPPPPPPVSSGGGGGGISLANTIITSGTNNLSTSTSSKTVLLNQPSNATTTVNIDNSSSGHVLGTATYNFRKGFGMGSSGEDVRALQQFLISSIGYDGPVTGYFGTLTRGAVMKYQAQQGILPVSGFIGEKTLALINKGQIHEYVEDQSKTSVLNIFQRDLGVGLNGDDVRMLQQKLTSMGWYTSPITGYFGNLTRDAVSYFQINSKIQPTGFFGSTTRAQFNLNTTTPATF